MICGKRFRLPSTRDLLKWVAATVVLVLLLRAVNVGRTDPRSDGLAGLRATQPATSQSPSPSHALHGFLQQYLLTYGIDARGLIKSLDKLLLVDVSKGDPVRSNSRSSSAQSAEEATQRIHLLRSILESTVQEDEPPEPVQHFPKDQVADPPVVVTSVNNNQVFMASPSLVVLDTGRYLVMLEETPHRARATASVLSKSIFASDDDGATWFYLASLSPMYWPQLFKCASGVYAMGTSAPFSRGNALVVSRMLDDYGLEWSAPVKVSSGLGVVHANTGADVSYGKVTRTFEAVPSLASPPPHGFLLTPLVVPSPPTSEHGYANATLTVRCTHVGTFATHDLVRIVPPPVGVGQVEPFVPGTRFFRVLAADERADTLLLRPERYNRWWGTAPWTLDVGSLVVAGSRSPWYPGIDWRAHVATADERTDLTDPAAWHLSRPVGNPSSSHQPALRALFDLWTRADDHMASTVVGARMHRAHSSREALDLGFGPLYWSEGVVVRAEHLRRVPGLDAASGADGLRYHGDRFRDGWAVERGEGPREGRRERTAVGEEREAEEKRGGKPAKSRPTRALLREAVPEGGARGSASHLLKTARPWPSASLRFGAKNGEETTKTAFPPPPPPPPLPAPSPPPASTPPSSRSSWVEISTAQTRLALGAAEEAEARAARTPAEVRAQGTAAEVRAQGTAAEAQTAGTEAGTGAAGTTGAATSPEVVDAGPRREAEKVGQDASVASKEVEWTMVDQKDLSELSGIHAETAEGREEAAPLAASTNATAVARATTMRPREVSPAPPLVSVMRVNNDYQCDMAALLEWTPSQSEPGRLQGRLLRYAFVPGLSVAHATLVFDRRSGLYWMASNVSRDSLRRWAQPRRPTSSMPLLHLNAGSRCEADRSTLALFVSADLASWEQVGVVAKHAHLGRHFSYPHMLVSGEDLLIVTRAAFNATATHATASLAYFYNNHNSNSVAFHRVRDFRQYAL